MASAQYTFDDLTATANEAEQVKATLNTDVGNAGVAASAEAQAVQARQAADKTVTDDQGQLQAVANKLHAIVTALYGPDTSNPLAVSETRGDKATS